MNDETPLDLRLLDPDETPDVVQGAMRRFRWRVVLLTVVTVIVAASLVGWGVGEYLHRRDVAATIEEAEPAERAIVEDHAGGFTCATPTFEIGPYDVALLQAARMPEGGWALHLVLHGPRSLASGTGRFMNFWPVGPGTRPASVPAQRGTTWADAFVAVPASLGDRFDVELWNLQNEVAGTFTVDASSLRCEF
jgi:hypothetical protein